MLGVDIVGSQRAQLGVKAAVVCLWLVLAVACLVFVSVCVI